MRPGIDGGGGGGFKVIQVSNSYPFFKFSSMRLLFRTLIRRCFMGNMYHWMDFKSTDNCDYSMELAWTEFLYL